MAVHDWGLDLEADGLRGFVQPIEISWTPEVRPADIACAGAMLTVLVYAITPERFFASVKQAHPEQDPWRDPSRFAVGSIHAGEVIGVTDWGYSVSIGEGVKGVILRREPQPAYETGQRLEVEIVSVDHLLRKVELAPRRPE